MPSEECEISCISVEMTRACSRRDYVALLLNRQLSWGNSKSSLTNSRMSICLGLAFEIMQLVTCIESIQWTDFRNWLRRANDATEALWDFVNRRNMLLPYMYNKVVWLVSFGVYLHLPNFLFCFFFFFKRETCSFRSYFPCTVIEIEMCGTNLISKQNLLSSTKHTTFVCKSGGSCHRFAVAHSWKRNGFGVLMNWTPRFFFFSVLIPALGRSVRRSCPFASTRWPL